MGWVLTSAPTEGAAADSVWDGDEWRPIADLPSNAFFYNQAAGITVEVMRSTQGEMQQRFTDRDVRMNAATQTITLA